MDSARLEKHFARIEALDNGRLERELEARLQELATEPLGDGAYFLAQVMGISIRAHLAAMPRLLADFDAWSRKGGGHSAPLAAAAERYWRQPDDEIDEQKHGLAGLLDDAWVIAWLAREATKSGLTVPGDLDLETFVGMLEHLLGEDMVARLTARLAAALPPRRPAPAVSPAPPSGTHDSRLVGAWHHSSYYSSGGFSHSSTRSRYLGADGRYVEGAQSFVTMVHRDSSGDETGRSAAASAGADARGRWSTAGSELTLEADNGDVYAFAYDYGGDSLLLSQPGREPKLWTRT